MDAAGTTGTFTFLFTDIEGSTLLWEQRASDMRSALERHDRILREAIESCAGRVVKTTGDGMLAVFDQARDALAASLAAQRGLQSGSSPTRATGTGGQVLAPLGIKVRMGLHTGAADVREGDYWGSSVNRAARIMSAAHGEQILLSATTADLARDALPDGVALRELGEHRLKGLLQPERLVQIVASGLRAEFPPFVTQTAYNLPAERDTFVGRSDALANLERRFGAGTRLVSVLGIGGAGKTRLVTRFGWNTLPRYTGGVWFCDLAQAKNADDVTQAVAQGLDVPLGKDDPVVQIGQAIAGRGPCMVILDNFEQVARHADQTVGRWMSRAHEARFLVTTREVLGLPGEETLALAPLANEDASELFLRRAEAAKPGFAPSADDAAAIGPLVRLLDGLPLAIELAAARVRVMPPRTLLARMTERFKLLATVGGRVDRQATLRAVFDWSWELLSLPEKAALAQLSVFEGGFALEAVEAVLDLSCYDGAPWPVDALQSLTQKSLVRAVGDDRFDLLVSVQEYAAEHLRTAQRYEGSGEEARLSAEKRHGAWFAGLDERASTANNGVELDNLVAACRRAVARGDAETAVSTLERAWACLRLRGPYRSAVELAAQVEGMHTPSPAIATRIDMVAGRALYVCGKTRDAATWLESALTGARAQGDARRECDALVYLGLLAGQQGRVDAMSEWLQAALDIAVRLDDKYLQGQAHNGLGQLNAIVGRPADARMHYERALLLSRQIGERLLEGAVLANLAILQGSTATLDEAKRSCQAALVVAQATGDRRLHANTQCQLGLLQFLEGEYDASAESLEWALAAARETGIVNLEVVVRCNLGMLHEARDDIASAQDHLESGLAIAQALGHKRAEGQVLGYLGLVHARRGDFTQARQCLDTGEALLQAASDPESLGILRAIRAESEQRAGCADAARAALAAAESVAGELSASTASEFGYALARARRSLGRTG